MNEPLSLPSPTQSTISPLTSLQEILHNRIKHKKGEIHESHNRAYNDKLWTEIETLKWVLAQILTYTAFRWCQKYYQIVEGAADSSEKMKLMGYKG